MKQTTTSIQISMELWSGLNKLRSRSSDTFEDVIRKLMSDPIQREAVVERSGAQNLHVASLSNSMEQTQ